MIFFHTTDTCNTQSDPMNPRNIYKRKGTLFFLLLLFAIALVWSNLYFTYYLSERRENCPFPCLGTTCRDCSNNVYKRRIPSVDIVHHLKLKQALRRMPNKSDTYTDNEPICKRPNFDLKHDSVKTAFYTMAALNCSREELYTVEPGGIFRMNRTKLGQRELEKCSYYGVERVDDDFQTYTEPHSKESEPFDLVIKQDFVRIKCFLKKPKDVETDVADADIELQEKDSAEEKHIKVQARQLLQYGSPSNKELRYKSTSFHIKPNQIIPDINNAQQKISKSQFTDTSGSHKFSSHKKDLQDVMRQIDELHFKEHVVNKSKTTKKYSNQRRLLQNIDEDLDYKQVEDNDKNDYYNNHYDDNFYAGYMYDFEEQNADFDQLLVQVYPKPEVFQRISKTLEQSPNRERTNVLIFGLDSMSHLSYQRKLPKTYSFLRDVLGSVILNGYNIVGDATTAALIPMLTGKFETELPEVRKNKYDSEYLDVYPLIWKDFQENGYATLFAEDEPTIGAFNLRLNGFTNPPTDHYMRPFWQALWDSEVHKKSPKFCTGNVPNHMYLINYLKDFFVSYSNVSKFAFLFGSELTHWDNNPGEYMDKDIVDFLTFLKVKGHLDNTVLVMMADHGARYSRVRKTVQGKMEERLPFMSVMLPQKFRLKYPHLYQNLLKNSDRLATPFDIYETLYDILDTQRTKNPLDHSKAYGISLLRPIPLNRTCSSAHIQMHWCTCLKQLELDPTDKHVQKSAGAFVHYINKGTSHVRALCAELKVKKIIHAYLLIPNEKVLMFQKSIDEDQREANFSENINIDHAHFQVTMETSPNNGMFEGTIQVNMTAGSYTVIEQDISRIDMYGNQPACVQDKYPDLRKYCYCNSSNSSGNNDKNGKKEKREFMIRKG